MVKKMIKQEIRKPKVQKRHRTIRINLAGTTEFPRLAVYRSTKHIYAQLIDDEKNVTICSASSFDFAPISINNCSALTAFLRSSLDAK